MMIGIAAEISIIKIYKYLDQILTYTRGLYNYNQSLYLMRFYAHHYLIY